MSERLRDSFNRLAKQQPKPVSLLEQSPVRFERLAAGRALPLLASPGVSDLDLPAWAAESRDRIDEQLLQAGGILFRGFGIASIEEFERLCAALSPALMDYSERSTPRSEVSGKVYTSTEYPADQEIPLHNELSYAHQWPRKIWFLCLRAAAEGGETPIADSRAVYGLIPEAVRERFVERQVMYVRNFGTGLGLSWSEVFQTEDRGVVEEHCAEAGIELEWGPGDRLRTRAVRPAVTRHPRTGDLVWFNQAHLHHVSSLPAEQRQALLEVVSPEELPFNTYYGDGTEIGEEELAEVRRAYGQATVRFAWQPGDVLMLDNVLSAHGRAPYTGDRKIVVAMAEI
jgi:alpha-ketoglutarate-dependent taurine dioxygenase